jgi:hypothetical protein
LPSFCHHLKILVKHVLEQSLQKQRWMTKKILVLLLSPCLYLLVHLCPSIQLATQIIE